MATHETFSRPKNAAKNIGVSLSKWWEVTKDPDFPPLHKPSKRVTLVSDQKQAAFIASKAVKP
jgi:hypothetical protein